MTGPPQPGSPWEDWPPNQALFGRADSLGAPAVAVDTSVVPTAPSGSGLDVLLFDEGAVSGERMAHNFRLLARYFNPLIRRGVFQLDQANEDTDIALAPDHITDALGYTPADADTPILLGSGLLGGGTLGSPQPIRFDDSVVRQIDIGLGQMVIFIRDAPSSPSENPVGGTFFYSEAGVLKIRGPSGTVTDA